MRNLSKAIASIGLILMSTGASAQSINFDTNPVGGGTIPDGTLADVFYLFSGFGVTFGCFNGNSVTLNICANAGTGGDAYIRSAVGAASSPNVIHLTATGLPFFDERFGYLKASFAGGNGIVSIDARPISPAEGGTITVNRPFMQAFNAQGQFLATANYNYGSCNPNTTQCPWQTLSISRPQNDIKFIAFSSYSSSGGVIYGEFDNLSYFLLLSLDTDGDGISDLLDNCTLVPNADQRDTNGDGYGNACDPDLNNDGIVNINDLNRLKARLNIVPVVDVDADLDGNGAVNINDLNRLKSYLGKPPGPSALHPNCPPTCP
jgi:hypothetical protein